MKVFMSGPVKAVENDPFEVLDKENTALVRQVPLIEDHRAFMVVPTGWEAVAQRQVAMALAVQPKLRVGFIVETSPLKAALMATCMAQQPTCTMALQAWHYLDKNCHLWLWSKRVGKIQEPNAPMHLVVSSWFSSRGCYVQPEEGGQFVKVGASSSLLPWKNGDSATETSWTAVTEKTPKVVESDVATSRHGRVRTLPSRCVDARQRYGDPSTREILFVPDELGSAVWTNLPTWKCHGCGEGRIGETCVFCNVLPNPMTVQDTVGMVQGNFPPAEEQQVMSSRRSIVTHVPVEDVDAQAGHLLGPGTRSNASLSKLLPEPHGEEAVIATGVVDAGVRETVASNFGQASEHLEESHMGHRSFGRNAAGRADSRGEVTPQIRRNQRFSSGSPEKPREATQASPASMECQQTEKFSVSRPSERLIDNIENTRMFGVHVENSCSESGDAPVVVSRGGSQGQEASVEQRAPEPPTQEKKNGSVADRRLKPIDLDGM